MVKFDVRSDIAATIGALRAEYGTLSEKATVQALNRSGTTMRIAGADEVKKIYTSLQISRIKGYFRLKNASRGRLTVEINPKGGRLPLTFFSALQWKAKGGGVSVVLGNETVFIPHAFIRKRGSRRDAVFLRAPDFKGQLYHKGTFRQKRVSSTGNDLPIAELFARSIPEVILRNGIDQTVVTIGEERFNVEFKRQMVFYLLNWKGNS